jgi:hypothetical protein
VPAGSEEVTIDVMSKAKEAAGKKVLKGPVRLKHQAHLDKGVPCVDCHHTTKEGEAPKPCGECHKDKADKQILKIDDAFHGGENENMPSLHSCIGCHKRKVYEKAAGTAAPWQKKPCESCHTAKKK